MSIGRTSAVWLLLAATSVAGEPTGIAWEKDLTGAANKAAASNRLMLLHFTAPWCGPCQNLEKSVFRDPTFASAVERDFVPVKLDFDDQRALASKLGVDKIPTDVVVTAQGQLVQRFVSPQKAGEYLGTLQRIATYSRTPPPADNIANTSSPQTGPAVVTPPSDPRYGNVPSAGASHLAANMPASGAQGAAPSSAISPLAAQIPPGSPPLALDGCCPVTLIEQRRWQEGDPRFGAVHRGRTYLFQTEAEQQRFLKNADYYTPMLAGNDPVLAIDENKQVPGRRAYGFIVGHRVFMFDNEATAQRFAQNPARYAPEISATLR